MEPAFRTDPNLAEQSPASPVLTRSYNLRNRDGYTIALQHDFPSPAGGMNAPLVLLCPGYGTTQQSYVAFAYALAGCGLQVLRYDHSRHIGLSDGDPSQTTFTSLEDDLDTVLAFTRENWPETPLTLLAPDLLGRIALRRQDWHRQLRRLILLNPTLDIGHCLTTLHQRDLLQEHVNGSRPGLGNLLGLPLDIDHFLADAITAQYTNVATLREELTHCGTDAVFLAAGQDWVNAPTGSALDISTFVAQLSTFNKADVSALLSAKKVVVLTYGTAWATKESAPAAAAAQSQAMDALTADQGEIQKFQEALRADKAAVKLLEEHKIKIDDVVDVVPSKDGEVQLYVR
jgi:alpha-beta hydrolase superfamily lysophospholipase